MLTEPEIISEVRSAWSADVPPTSEGIVTEQWGDYGECLAAFNGRSWESLSFEEVMCNRSCVTFFNPPAVHYYLPAFIVASMRERREFQFRGDITDYALQAIQRDMEHRKSITHVDRQKRTAILHYLEFLQQMELTNESLADVVNVFKLVLSTVK